MFLVEIRWGIFSDDGDFTKRVIPYTYKEELSKFLREDKQGFENYAIQNTIINFKHSLSMEKFNFTYKTKQNKTKLGVPITLNPLRVSYVLEKWKDNFEMFFLTGFTVCI